VKLSIYSSKLASSRRRGVRNCFPARYLKPGDVAEIEVDEIGVLRNTIGPNWFYSTGMPRTRPETMIGN